MKYLFNLIYLAAMLFIFLGATVTVLRYGFKKTENETREILKMWAGYARRILKYLWQFIKDAFNELAGSESSPMPAYNVLIGYNGYCIIDEEVYRQFAKLEEIWETARFDGVCQPYPHTITYCFSVYGQRVQKISKRDLLNRIRHIAEKALTRHFHDLGAYGLDIRRFVAVTLDVDKLWIHFANDNAGFQVVERLRQSAR